MVKKTKLNVEVGVGKENYNDMFIKAKGIQKKVKASKKLSDGMDKMIEMFHKHKSEEVKKEFCDTHLENMKLFTKFSCNVLSIIDDQSDIIKGYLEKDLNSKKEEIKKLKKILG